MAEIRYLPTLGPSLRRALQIELERLMQEYDEALAGPRRRELARRASAIADLLGGGRKMQGAWRVGQTQDG
jgi:hypothetical protein